METVSRNFENLGYEHDSLNFISAIKLDAHYIL